MLRFGSKLFRSSEEERPPVDPGGKPDREPRLLTRMNSKDNGPGQRKDADTSGRRSRNRDGSTPTDNRNQDRRAQDGQMGFPALSADDSWAWGQNWVNTLWATDRDQAVQVQVSGQLVVRGGRPQEDRRGRGHHSNDARRPKPVRTVSPPRLTRSAPSPPAELPMGLKDLLRKSPRDRNKILFYNKNEPHYGFTNFSPHSVVFRGKKYPTAGHLFHSLKFLHKPNLMEHIRTYDPRPSVAYGEARRFAYDVHPEWQSNNTEAMEIVLQHKFIQHRDLKQELLATGDAELIENSDTDSFWGCGADGKGRNEMGKALMRVRKQLRERERW